MRGCPGTEAPAPLKVTLLRVQLRWATTSQRKLKHAVQFPAEQCCPEWSLQTCSRRSSFPLQQHIKKWIQTLRDSRYHEPVSKFTVTITRGAFQRPGALCSICSPKMWSLNPTWFFLGTAQLEGLSTRSALQETRRFRDVHQSSATGWGNDILGTLRNRLSVRGGNIKRNGYMLKTLLKNTLRLLRTCTQFDIHCRHISLLVDKHLPTCD